MHSQRRKGTVTPLRLTAEKRPAGQPIHVVGRITFGYLSECAGPVGKERRSLLCDSVGSNEFISPFPLIQNKRSHLQCFDDYFKAH